MSRNEEERNPAPDVSRRDLLHDLISPWRRRGRKLLQIGGSSLVPPLLFWEAGFDAFCLERVLEVLQAAREENGQRVEYVLGQPDLLPFEDDSFEYAVLPDISALMASGTEDALFTIVAEAVRTASHGIILMSGNPLSPANWKRGKRCFWPWTLWMTARRAAPRGRLTLRGACRLPLAPGRIFRFYRERKGMNIHPCWCPQSLISPFPFGGVYGLRLDCFPLAGTPTGVLRVPGIRSYGKEAAMGSSGLGIEGTGCSALGHGSGEGEKASREEASQAFPGRG